MNFGGVSGKETYESDGVKIEEDKISQLQKIANFEKFAQVDGNGVNCGTEKICQMGQTGQMGKMGQMGQMGLMGPMGGMAQIPETSKLFVKNKESMLELKKRRKTCTGATTSGTGAGTKSSKTLLKLNLR